MPASAPDSRTRDPEATRASILEAAEAVFVEKGFADASMSEIARSAGVTKSLIHHHFGSKEGLWQEVKHHRFGEYARAQQAILEESESDAGVLRRSVEEYFRFLARNPSFARLVSWMHLEEAGGEFVPGEKLMEAGVEKIRAAQEAGDLRDDVHPFFMLTSFIGLAEHWFQSKEHHCRWCRQVLETEDLQDDEKYLDALLKIFFEGVRPAAAKADG